MFREFVFDITYRFRCNEMLLLGYLCPGVSGPRIVSVNDLPSYNGTPFNNSIVVIVRQPTLVGTMTESEENAASRVSFPDEVVRVCVHCEQLMVK